MEVCQLLTEPSSSFWLYTCRVFNRFEDVIKKFMIFALSPPFCICYHFFQLENRLPHVGEIIAFILAKFVITFVEYIYTFF